MKCPGIELLNNAELRGLNTLAFAARAHCLALINDPAALPDLLADRRWQTLPRLVLAGGSNVVIAGDLDALVLHPRFAGIQLEQSDSANPLVIVEAGYGWARLVEWTLAQGCFGLENLGLIPGQCGAAPIQNIGAYGVELERFVEWVEWLELPSGTLHRTQGGDARFAYRDSCFKQLSPGSFLIVRLALRLQRRPELRIDYPGLREALAADGVVDPTPVDVHRIVCALRRSKLPDPAVTPNAGSFFKNPWVSAEHADRLNADFPRLPRWPQTDGRCKLSAAWLIEQCGFKGLQRGPVGVSAAHALVMTHSGGGSGLQLLQLAADIQRAVMQKFGCELEIEPVRL